MAESVEGAMEVLQLPSNADGAVIRLLQWRPADTPRGLLLIAHGMGEHAARYDRFARAATAAGLLVAAPDHRGHGPDAPQAGDLGVDGWEYLIQDLAQVAGALREQYPGVPLTLMGHSMGSMATQQYLTEFSTTIDAAILSGSPGFGNPFTNWLAHTVARFERWRLGADGHSALLEKLMFSDSNKPFEEPEHIVTGFEWLSRDRAEVARYVADPHCGFVLLAGSVCQMFTGVRRTANLPCIRKITPHLPVLVFSGEDDPLHGGQSGITRMLKRFEKAGMDQVTVRWYPGGRHEMLNETNRDEVTGDILDWLVN